jgi:excisionase family DNA binding protein
MDSTDTPVVADNRKRSARATAHHPNSATFALKELAALIGCNLEAARRLLVTGRIPAIKIGTSWRVLRRDAMTYLTTEAERQAAERRQALGGEQ